MADSTGDLLGKIRELSSRDPLNEQALRQAFDSLEKALRDVVGAVECSGQSQVVRVLGWGSADDYTNGRLYFGPKGLAVGSRGYDDDYADRMGDSEPGTEGRFELRELSATPVEWLAKFSSREIIESLMTSMIRQLEDRNARHRQAAASVAARAGEAISRIDQELEAQAKRVDFQQVLLDWHKAQVAEGEPETAIAQALTLLESVCWHLNDRWKLGVEPKVDTSNLYGSVQRVAAARLGASGFAEEAQQILGGIGGIVRGVRNLRNEGSSAHGRAPGARKPTQSLARLAINTAGVAATFLMELVESETDGKN